MSAKVCTSCGHDEHAGICGEVLMPQNFIGMTCPCPCLARARCWCGGTQQASDEPPPAAWRAEKDGEIRFIHPRVWLYAEYYRRHGWTVTPLYESPPSLPAHAEVRISVRKPLPDPPEPENEG